jgi:hypothetical protein
MTYCDECNKRIYEDQMLAYRPQSELTNMDLPFKKKEYQLLECPNCKEICAYQMPSLSAKCVYVCDWCDCEF